MDTQVIHSVEDMAVVARDVVTQYCQEHDLNEKDIQPNIWNDIITELNVVIFGPCNRMLRNNPCRYNEYDISKVEWIYKNIYKRLCDSHAQEVTQKGFCDMIGIEKRTLYDWESDRLSLQRSHLREKIMDDNEESLFALMKDRRMNPMKLLPKLNKVHGWNMPGVGREKQKETAANPEQIGEKYGTALPDNTIPPPPE